MHFISGTTVANYMYKTLLCPKHLVNREELGLTGPWRGNGVLWVRKRGKIDGLITGMGPVLCSPLSLQKSAGVNSYKTRWPVSH